MSFVSVAACLNEVAEGVTHDDHFQNYDFSKLGLPVVVKPSGEGSTCGLTIVKEKGCLGNAINKAFDFGDDVLVEEYIDGRELTVGVLGEKTLPVIEIQPYHSHYDFDCKYIVNFNITVCYWSIVSFKFFF